MSFAQNGQRRDLSNVRCYSCQQMGHYANTPDCPNYKPNSNKSNNQDSKNNTGTPPGGYGVNVLIVQWQHTRQLDPLGQSVNG